MEKHPIEFVCCFASSLGMIRKFSICIINVMFNHISMYCTDILYMYSMELWNIWEYMLGGYPWNWIKVFLLLDLGLHPIHECSRFAFGIWYPIISSSFVVTIWNKILATFEFLVSEYFVFCLHVLPRVLTSVRNFSNTER